MDIQDILPELGAGLSKTALDTFPGEKRRERGVKHQVCLPWHPNIRVLHR